MPWPIIFNVNTGQWEEVNEAEAAAEFGIPIGEPRSSQDRPTGGAEMPGNEPPDYYNPGARQLWASNERGVPRGYSQRPPPGYEIVDDDEEEEQEEPQYESGLGTTFGYNDPGESPIGAWGDPLDTPDAFGVALPRQTLRDHFGDEDKAQGALVEVVNPATGQKIVAPIIDKGPAEWVIKRQGPTIDLTEGARQAIGGTGMDKMQWRVIGHGGKPVADLPPGYEIEGGQPSTSQQGIQELPEGYEIVSQPQQGPLKIEDAIDPKADYMNKPRDTAGVKRIILHGDVSDDADNLINYGRHVDPQRGFAPGYHYYVARDGTVKQGAPDDRITNHTLGENADSLGIIVVGADEGKMPTDAQIVATKQLIAKLGTQYNIDPGNVIGHGELQPNRKNKLEGGTIAKEIREQGYGDYREAGAGKLPPGYEIVSEPGATTAGPREVLIDAITKTEAEGYKVSHTIGKPDEPEGDRAPTIDMENLVGVLKQKEADAAKIGDYTKAADAQKQRAYWENEIKVHGMTADQAEAGEAAERAKGLAPASKVPLGERQLSDQELVEVRTATPTGRKGLSLEQAKQVEQAVAEAKVIGIADTAGREAKEKLAQQTVDKFTPVGEREAEAGHPRGVPGRPPPPTVPTETARKLGLTNWIEPDTGMEVRRAVPTEVGKRQMATQKYVPYQRELEAETAPEDEKPGQWPEGRKISATEQLANVARMTGLPIPTLESLKSADQAAARLVRGIQEGVQTADVGLHQAITAGAKEVEKGQQNPFAGKPKEEAQAAIPDLQKAVDAAQVNLSQMASSYDEDSSAVQDAIKVQDAAVTQLRWAQKAAAGDTKETFIAPIARSVAGASEAVTKDIQAKQAQAEKKWAPYIDKARDKEWGMRLYEGIGRSLPSGAASMVNPIFGLSTMWTTTYADARKEYEESMAKQGKPVVEALRDKYAFDQANLQTPWEVFGDVAGARALKTAFKTLPKNLMEQEAGTVGKWIVDNLKHAGAAIFGETAITTPAQSITQDIIAERAGVQEPTTAGEKAVKAAKQMPISAVQSTLMFGLPVAVGGAVQEGRAGAIKEKLTAKEVEKPQVYKDLSQIPPEVGVKPPPIPGTEPTAPIAKAPKEPAEPPPIDRFSKVSTQVRQDRAEHMWDNAKPGDVYTHPSGNTVTIQGKEGERRAEITSRKGEVVDTLHLDKEGGPPLSGDGLIYGAEMTKKAPPAPATPPGPNIQVPWTGVAPTTAAPAAGPTIAPVPSVTPPGMAPKAAPAATAPTAAAIPAAPQAPPVARLPGTPPPLPGEVKPTVSAEEEGPTSEADLERLREKYRGEITGKPGAEVPSGTTAEGVLEFDDEQPTPERSTGIRELEAALTAHPRSGGQPVSLIPVSRRVGRTKKSKALNRAIDGLEKLFNKKVQFVRSGTGRDLPFTGIVHPSDPNTIYLDAAGDRNVLALIGHEWGHTLKVSNPQLHRQMVEQMKPLVKDWAKQEGELKEKQGYPEADVSDEVASNEIGDAFTRPDFWKQLNKKNPSLFKRAVKAVNDFFKSLIAKVQGSEWGTEEFISDLEAMHKVIADAINQAVTKGPEPSLKQAMEGVKGEKIKEAMGGLQFAGRPATKPKAAEPSEERKLAFANRRKVEKGFYNRVDDVVDMKLPNMSTPEQAKATINGAGLKAEEIKWTGVIPAIDEIAKANNGKVPKAELSQYLENEGKVRLEEIVKQGKAVFQETGEELGTRYDQPNLVLPGGENYREVVMSMPEGKGPTYTSSHFPDIPNYVAHMRLNDRTDANGEPGTFLEELQSDRHQQGREKGYKAPTGKWGVHWPMSAELRSIAGANLGQRYNTFDTKAQAEAAAKEMNANPAWGEHSGFTIKEGEEGEIPDAPFRKDWPLALFKRALRDAVSFGHKWIGWTNGDTQSKRYDLSKQVDEVKAIKDTKGNYLLTAIDKYGTTHDLGTMGPEKLADTIGKDLAVKIVEQPAGVSKVYKGGDLKVGGEGMRGFYDKILPNEIGKYVKQWGGKVEKSAIETETGAVAGGLQEFNQWAAENNYTFDPLTEWRKDSSEWVNRFLEEKRHKTTPTWRVEITPQMKEGVAVGQPQFATRRKAPSPKAPSKPAPERKAEPIIIKPTRHGNIGKAYESTTDLLRRSGAPELARALQQDVDSRAAYMGKWLNKAYKALPWWERVKKYTPIELAQQGARGALNIAGRAVHMKTRSARMSKEEQEFSDYFDVFDRDGREAADKLDILPGTRRMVNAAHDILPEIGDEAERLGVMNRHPDTGKWSLFKKIEDYFPRVIRKDVLQAIQYPGASESQIVLDEVRQSMIDEGSLPIGAPDYVFKEKLDNFRKVQKENGFMGSLEVKRTRDLPHSAYDRSYATFLDYIRGASTRLAQVKAYGQGKGGKEVAPEGTLFDLEIKRAGNEYTENYIKLLRHVVFGGQDVNRSWAQAVAGIRNLGVTAQLGTLRFPLRNLIFGLGHNYGSVRGAPVVGELKFILSLLKTHREIKSGYERGNFQHDVANMMHDGEVSGTFPEVTSRIAGAGLRAVGAKAGETFVRANTLAIARMNLRRAMKVYGKNPKSIESRQFLGWVKRLGFEGTEGHDLLVERGEGPLFQRYMRRAANRIQSGYSFADSPLVLNTTEGKSFLQYTKWNVEQFNRFAKDVITPALRAYYSGNYRKETVQILNPDGTKENVNVPGEIMTPLRYLIGTAVAGAAGEWLLEKLLGVPAQTVRIAKFLETARQGTIESFMKSVGWVAAHMMQAGAGGMASNIAQTAWDIRDARRYKNPFEIPFLQPPQNALDAILNLIDERNFTPEHIQRRLDEFLEITSGGYRDIKNVGAQFTPLFGVGGRAMASQLRQIHLNKVRSLVRQYEQEAGLAEKVRQEAKFGKTERSPFRDAFHEDLIMGDTDAAQERMDKEFENMSPERRKLEMEALKNSMRSKLPIKVGSGSKEELKMFKEWAEENTTPSEQDMIENIDSEYKDAARTVLRIEFEKPTPRSLQDYMRRMDHKKEPTNPPTGFSVLWQR